MTSIPTNLPYTVNNGLVNPATPGAYLNNNGSGSFPVFCSITSFTNYGMENIVDIAVLMPGYKITLYVDAAYAGVATTYTNTTGSNITVQATTPSTASSCKLYYKDVEITISGIS